MRSIWMICGLVAVAGLVAACGSDSSDGGGVGGGATGGAGGGGATGGAGGGGNESWQAAGSCVLSAKVCVTYECDANTGVCESVETSGAQGCELASGTWTAGQECTKANALGTCIEALSAGKRTATTSYADGTLTADDYKTVCTNKQGTWTVP